MEQSGGGWGWSSEAAALSSPPPRTSLAPSRTATQRADEAARRPWRRAGREAVEQGGSSAHGAWWGGRPWSRPAAATDGLRRRRHRPSCASAANPIPDPSRPSHTPLHRSRAGRHGFVFIFRIPKVGMSSFLKPSWTPPHCKAKMEPSLSLRLAGMWSMSCGFLGIYVH